MPRYVFLFLASFAAAVAIGIAVAMINSGGRADLNAYGEGWVEAALAGILAVLGFQGARK